MSDHYKTLGVSRSASKVEIKKAFHKLASRYHPDRNPNATEEEKTKFKEINAAYTALSDDKKRANYDRFGTEDIGSPGAGFSDFAQGFGASSFSDIFNDFLGGGRASAQSSQRGSDLQFGINITLEEAFSGAKKEIDFERMAACDNCSGSGALPGSIKEICRHCNGRGVIRNQRGFFTLQQDCPHCMGYGEKSSKPCGSCNGQGRKKKHEKIKFSIPAGIADETPIKIKGKGEAGHGGGSISGDLYVFIKTSEHSRFVRVGDDLKMELEVPFWDVILGGQALIKTLNSKTISLKIPPCTQNGKVFRLFKKGMPSGQMFKSAGDLYIKVNVKIPSKINKEQEKLLKEAKATDAVGGS